jgi:GTP-binding protein
MMTLKWSLSFRKRENLMNLFVLIDSWHTHKKIDLAFVNQSGNYKLPLILLFTEADMENQQTMLVNVKAFPRVCNFII